MAQEEKVLDKIQAEFNKRLRKHYVEDCLGDFMNNVKKDFGELAELYATSNRVEEKWISV